MQSRPVIKEFGLVGSAGSILVEGEGEFDLPLMVKNSRAGFITIASEPDGSLRVTDGPETLAPAIV